jgi:hypothetical protein
MGLRFINPPTDPLPFSTAVPPNKFLRGVRHDRSPDLDGRRRGETLTPRWVQDLDSDPRRADPSRHCARAVILAV